MRHGVWARSLVACVALTAGLVLAGGTDPAAACSCASASEAEHFDMVDSVFVGRLVEQTYANLDDGYQDSDRDRLVFEVTDVFKGDVFARQTVDTPPDSGLCGMELVDSGRYVVFARTLFGPDGKALTTGLCSGNRRVSDGPVPASFGAARAPLEEPDVDVTPASTDSVPDERAESTGDTREDVGIALAGVLSGGAAVAVLVWARRRGGR